MTSRSTIEKSVFVIVALILSGALWRAISGGNDVGTDGDQRTQVVLAFMYLAVASLVTLQFRASIQSFARNPALLVLLLLACASPLWADTPDLISRRALALVGKSLFGVALATRYTFEDQLKMFRVAFRVGALLTFVLIAISPARALSGADGGGGIRGVFPHKNILGGVMALALRWDHDDLEALPKTLRWVQSLGTEVVLFGPIVQYDSALPRLLAMSIRSNDATIPALHRVAYYERLDADMSKLAQADPGVRYISYFKILCRQSACLEYAGAGVRLQSDYGHLTIGGSVLVATKIRETGGLN